MIGIVDFSPEHIYLFILQVFDFEFCYIFCFNRYHHHLQEVVLWVIKLKLTIQGDLNNTTHFNLGNKNLGRRELELYLKGASASLFLPPLRLSFTTHYLWSGGSESLYLFQFKYLAYYLNIEAP